MVGDVTQQKFLNIQALRMYLRAWSPAIWAGAAGGYLLANIMATLCFNYFVQDVMRVARGQGVVRAQPVILNRTVNYRDLVRVIKERNLFNKDGEFPDEPEPGMPSNKPTNVVFDDHAPCTDSSLNVELVGTIYMGSSMKSFATIREKGYEIADIYKVGDPIIGHEQAKVYEIKPNEVIINNAGKKECLKFRKVEEALSAASSSPASTQVVGPPPGPEVDVRVVELEAAYVREQLGDNLERILQKGNLVPFPAAAPQIKGFKLIGVTGDSLFTRIGLRNGDVITQVNDVSLQEPDKGFSFYQAFQDDEEIRINILRGGTQPMVINVKIR